MNIPRYIIRDRPIMLIMLGITPKMARSKIITKTSVIILLYLLAFHVILTVLGVFMEGEMIEPEVKICKRPGTSTNKRLL